MNKIRLFFRKTFGFSKIEINGFFVLSLILFVYFIIYLTIDFNSNLTDNTQDELVLNEIVSDYLKNKKETKTSIDKTEIQKDTVNYYPFDPNTLSYEEWLSFGLSENISKRIINYLNKGGKFRRNDDLKKIYGFPIETYSKLEPYISVASAKKTIIKENNSALNSEKKKHFNKETEVLQPFNINSATEEQLIMLKGIGKYWAGRIIKYRDALGGFSNITQYNEIYGIDSLKIASLNEFTFIESEGELKQLNINTLTVEELAKHPYITFKTARLLVAYREQHGNYTSSSDILKIHQIDENWVRKIEPYLFF